LLFQSEPKLFVNEGKLITRHQICNYITQSFPTTYTVGKHGLADSENFVTVVMENNISSEFCDRFVLCFV